MKAAGDRSAGDEPVRDGAGPRRPVQSGAPAAARPRAVDARTLQRLQAGAGNAAVARLVARPTGGASSGAAPAATTAAGAAPAVQRLDALPVAPTGLTPATDPRFKKVAGDLRAKKAVLTKHPTAASQAKAAQDAAKPPGDDKEAQAKAAQAGEMGTAKPGVFDKAAFVAAVSAAIAAKAPKTLDEADTFTASGKTDEIKSQVAGQVTAGKEGSAKDITEKTAKAPDESRAVEKPVTPLPGQPAPPTLAPPDPKAAAVAKAPPEQTDLSTGPKETDAMMAQAKVTPEQLAASNEPQFKEALDAKKESDVHAATAPAQFREKEAARVAAEQGGAAAAGPAGVQAMTAAKAGAAQQVAAGQGAAQSKEEQERARVAAEIKGVFDATKKEVEGILGALDTEVETAFDTGQKAAKAAFDADHRTKMKAWKDERYSGVTGAARWLADAVLDPPPRANQIFAEARLVYEREMRTVISDIADLIGKRLADAQNAIARGKQRIADKVAEQPASLRKFAQQAANDIGGQFRQLESSVAEKSQSLVQDLADRYVAARGELDEEIKKLQEENKGLLSKAKDAVAGTIETVLKLKDMLLGVLARAAGAIDKIITNPIGFLGNLVNAVKAGVTGFAARIGEHLKNGLKQWLFGQLSAGGIELPETFDAKGIMRLILSILGLTWTNVRARIVARIGEPAMAALETGFEMVQVLMAEGLGGLWKWIVDKLADLKDTVVGAIKDFVIEKIVTAGITWIVSLLNPASAFVRACKAIYDVVMFFVNRAAQIKSFVDSVLDSVEGIANGGGGGVPAMIEGALSKAIPVVLDFLASLLGLGGISAKIKDILEKVQAPVMKAVDWVIDKIVNAGKKILAALKKKAEGPDVRTMAEKEADVAKAKEAAGKALKAEGATPEKVRKALPDIKKTYRLTNIELTGSVQAGYQVQVEINPRAATDLVTLNDIGVPVEEVKAAVADARAQLRTAQGKLAERRADGGKEPLLACGGGVERTVGGGQAGRAAADSQRNERGTNEHSEAFVRARAEAEAAAARVTSSTEVGKELLKARTQEERDALMASHRAAVREARAAARAAESLAGADPGQARLRLEGDAAKWDEFGRLPKLGMGPAEAGDDKEFDDRLDAAFADPGVSYPDSARPTGGASNAMASLEDRRTPDYAGAMTPGNEHYVPTPGPNDRGGLSGTSAIVHAEKMAYRAASIYHQGTNAIGVTLHQCDDCQAWFRSQAGSAGKFLVVADPGATRIFLPDGRVTTAEQLGL
ncbi:phage tail protein [Streptomyces tritici]|uniref:phage tail protein n=1 Tax=Streptomyces tritici TaxID=2054410 RepID=UPI003AF09887